MYQNIFCHMWYGMYQNIFCHIQTAPFAHESVRHMGIYFPRILITTAKHVVKVETIKYLGKYMTICLILPCEKEEIYMIIVTKIAFLYFT